MKKPYFTAQRITLDAIMIALFVGLSFLSFIVAGVKVTIEDLPVVICAVVFGPIDAAIVGFLGEFMNQMLSPMASHPQHCSGSFQPLSEAFSLASAFTP